MLWAAAVRCEIDRFSILATCLVREQPPFGVLAGAGGTCVEREKTIFADEIET